MMQKSVILHNTVYCYTVKKNILPQLHIFTSAMEVVFSPMSFVGWFVTGIKHKQLNRFPQILDRGWVLTQKRAVGGWLLQIWWS